MTTRSLINLSAFAIIAGGGFMLLDAKPAAAAVFATGCEKLDKIIFTQSSACLARGGTYVVNGSCSDVSVWYEIDSTCKY
jgi:hypothetical protein